MSEQENIFVLEFCYYDEGKGLVRDFNGVFKTIEGAKNKATELEGYSMYQNIYSKIDGKFRITGYTLEDGEYRFDSEITRMFQVKSKWIQSY